MNSNKTYITEKEWESLISTLSPTKIEELEKSLKTYQTKYQSDEMTNNVSSNKENDEFDHLDVTVKDEPVTINKPFFNSHKTKNRGLTYENGRRNLKSEPVTGEEKERRAKRRERNRVAAQKCRERRQQQIDELQHQVEMLKSTEQKLNSALKELSEEENDLRIKLSNHNCIISENSSGSLSFLIQQNFIDNNLQYSQPICCLSSQAPIISSHSLSRPNSLPLSNQTYSGDFSNSKDNNLYKDDTFTHLFNSDSYNMLRCQIQSGNTPTSLLSGETENKYNESKGKVVFSWSNSIVEQLSLPSIDHSSNVNYLSTPIVDMPFYAAHTYSQSDDHTQQMNWNSSQ